MSKNHPTPTNLGKFNLIDHLTTNFKLHNKNSVQSSGEDAAVIQTDQEYTLVTTHTSIEGVHFDLTYCPLKHVGYKAVITSIAGIAAMNGLAEQITLHISCSNRFNLTALQELYDGIHAACKQYRLDLVKVDHSTIPTGLIIIITAIGKASKQKICFRKGAKPYDLVCVTGNLGAAYLGLQILIREKKVLETAPAMQPQLAPYTYVIARQLKPEVPTDTLRLLHEAHVIPTSMIHIADGLASAVLLIGKASEVGITIYENKLPINQQTYQVAEKLYLSPTMCALHGGEDYELLFTIPQTALSQIANRPTIRIIGHITEVTQGVKLVTNNDSVVAITAQGWNISEEEPTT